VPIVNQYANLIHLGISFCILFIIMAAVIFREEGEDAVPGERFFSRYIKMVFLIIIVGYGFVILKLYEVISLFIFICLLSIFWRLPAGKRIDVLKEKTSSLIVLFYEISDGRFSLLNWLKDQSRRIMAIFWYKCYSMLKDPLNYLLFGVILGSAYLRFYDPLTHAAPGLSDSTVVQAWMNYISNRVLFHDEIYPQGMHIFDATLRKFAATDPIYVVKYAGPFNGVLTTIALHFFTSRLTGRKTAGIIAAFVFGVLGPFLPLGWERQAATNSQEFALVFLVLAWYFVIRYLENKEKRLVITGAASLSVMGLAHSLIWAYACLGVLVICLSFFFIGPLKNLKAILNVALAGVFSVVISALPMLIGLLMGKSFNSAAESFLTDSLTADITKLTYLDYVAVGGIIGIIILFLLSRWLKEKPEPLLFVILMSVISLFSYMYLGWLTGNAVLVTRIGILWSIIAALAIGMGWHAIMKILIRIKLLEILLCFTVLIAATYFYKPMPSVPYKMLYDSMVNQFVRISDEFTPTEWMIVSNEEGYPYVLGKGFHMQLWDFADNYRPESKKLENIQNVEVMMTPDIFIIVEKKVFEPPLTATKERVEKRKAYYTQIENWVSIYKSFHDNITVYYEDENIKVYHIHQEKEKEFNQVWNIQDNT